MEDRLSERAAFRGNRDWSWRDSRWSRIDKGDWSCIRGDVRDWSWRTSRDRVAIPIEKYIFRQVSFRTWQQRGKNRASSRH